jgi:transcriptional regulator with XRE-family HTH domain
MKRTFTQKPLRYWVQCHNIAALARRLECDQRTIARWVRGRSVPPTDKLFALARLIRVEPQYIAVGPSAKENTENSSLLLTTEATE